MRLSQAARKFNVGIARIAELLESKGFDIDSKPNTKITDEQLSMLEKEFESSMAVKREAAGLTIGSSHNDIVIKSDKKTTPPPSEEVEDEDEILIYDKSANAKTESDKAEKKEEPAQKEEKSSEPDTISAKPAGLKIIGKIELDDKGRPVTNKPKKEEPVAKEEPVVQKEEPKKEEPVVAKEEPVVQKEEPKKEEPVAKEEPVV
ncbi:MAG: translation initiation factor IF-2, partial [Thalassobius sp.]|nr:translation initiation factor IF-2 [Thalassovita sp.]